MKKFLLGLVVFIAIFAGLTIKLSSGVPKFIEEPDPEIEEKHFVPPEEDVVISDGESEADLGYDVTYYRILDAKAVARTNGIDLGRDYPTFCGYEIQNSGDMGDGETNIPVTPPDGGDQEPGDEGTVEQPDVPAPISDGSGTDYQDKAMMYSDRLKAISRSYGADLYMEEMEGAEIQEIGHDPKGTTMFMTLRYKDGNIIKYSNLTTVNTLVVAGDVIRKGDYVGFVANDFDKEYPIIGITPIVQDPNAPNYRIISDLRMLTDAVAAYVGDGDDALPRTPIEAASGLVFNVGGEQVRIFSTGDLGDYVQTLNGPISKYGVTNKGVIYSTQPFCFDGDGVSDDHFLK